MQPDQGLYNGDVPTGTSPTQDETAGLKGKTVDALFPLFLRFNPGLEGLRFESFRSGPGISERMQNALALHPEWFGLSSHTSLTPEPGVSSWDKFAARYMATGESQPLSDDILLAVIRHAPNPADGVFEVTPSKLQSEGISEQFLESARARSLRFVQEFLSSRQMITTFPCAIFCVHVPSRIELQSLVCSAVLGMTPV